MDDADIDRVAIMNLRIISMCFWTNKAHHTQEAVIAPKQKTGRHNEHCATGCKQH